MSLEEVMLIEAELSYNQTVEEIKAQIEKVGSTPFADPKQSKAHLDELNAQMQAAHALHYMDFPVKRKPALEVA